ncbi:MAG: hypothetical protein IT319_14700 [Anaerolineae bacterium]|nr:hypothetical protein [Anaerolineae bacterium]
MSQADIQPISDDSVEQIAERAQNAMKFSLIFSGVRCTLQYVVLPVVLPIFGIAGAVAVPFLLVINVLAIVSILYSVRRFWQINYKYKWHYLGFSVVMLVILASFIASDLVPESF